MIEQEEVDTLKPWRASWLEERVIAIATSSRLQLQHISMHR
jgi:hypothetical protein